jgi:hypothetical protein
VGKGKKHPKLGSDPAKSIERPSLASAEDEKVAISFEFYEHGNAYCLSSCDRANIARFLDCFRKVNERTWPQLIAASHKGKGKAGLNSTTYDREALNNPHIWPDWVGSNESLIGFRASEVARLYGIRRGNKFHVVWFDPRHEIING